MADALRGMLPEPDEGAEGVYPSLYRFFTGAGYGGRRRIPQQPDPTVKPGVQSQFSVPLMTPEERRQRELARILQANPKYDR